MLGTDHYSLEVERGGGGGGGYEKSFKKCLQKLNRPNKLFADMKKTVCRKLPQEKKIVCTNNSMETIILFVLKNFHLPLSKRNSGLLLSLTV